MKKAFYLLLLITLFSCEKNDAIEEEFELLNINITSKSSTDNSIKLEWNNVEGVSWYFVQYNLVGEVKQETIGYQNLINETIDYDVDDLESGKEYEITILGKDYLSGGDLVATSETIKISTKAIDPIIGVWYPFSDESVEESECRKKSTFSFSKDGKWESIGIIDDSFGTCQDDFNYNGIWENAGINKYRISEGEDLSTIEVSEITFSENNSNMIIGTGIYKRK